MRSLALVSSLLALLFAAAVQALSSSGSRLLAILDDVAEKEGYSTFLGDLESRGFKITYETPKSESLSLFRLGQRTYDHVIFFPSKAKGLGPNLTPQILLEFMKAEGNILAALSSGTAAPTSLVSVLSEFDITLPAERTGLVVDHFHYDAASAAEQHDVLLLPPPTPSRPDVKDLFGPGQPTTELLAFPRGVGHLLGAGPLLAPIVSAPRTAYSYNPKEQGEAVSDGADLFAAGAQLKLVSAMQARNAARFVLLGSAEMLSDAWLDGARKVKAPGSGKEVGTYNREFARRLSGWVFQETGVLRVNWVEHVLNEEGAANLTNPKIYRVKNDVTYSISLSEYAWDKWTPFAVPGTDELQLEFSMLSPFHRLKLSPAPAAAQTRGDATTYTVSFTLPDQHGIFNFMVEYRRPFLTPIEEKRTVSVRHMAHDEWPRSYAISGAWPWLSGISATVIGWLAFCAVWMFSRPVGKAPAGKKTQ